MGQAIFQCLRGLAATWAMASGAKISRAKDDVVNASAAAGSQDWNGSGKLALGLARGSSGMSPSKARRRTILERTRVAVATAKGLALGLGVPVLGLSTLACLAGSVELEEVVSRDVVVDTGSGSVDIELLTDVDVLEVDTGSGSVTIRAPADLGARVEIDTGSGGIDLDFPLEVRSVRRDHVEGQIGDGRGQIEIDTGSGSVRLLRCAPASKAE